MAYNSTFSCVPFFIWWREIDYTIIFQRQTGNIPNCPIWAQYPYSDLRNNRSHQQANVFYSKSIRAPAVNDFEIPIWTIVLSYNRIYWTINCNFHFQTSFRMISNLFKCVAASQKGVYALFGHAPQQIPHNIQAKWWMHALVDCRIRLPFAAASEIYINLVENVCNEYKLCIIPYIVLHDICRCRKYRENDEASVSVPFIAPWAPSFVDWYLNKGRIEFRWVGWNFT